MFQQPVSDLHGGYEETESRVVEPKVSSFIIYGHIWVSLEAITVKRPIFSRKPSIAKFSQPKVQRMKVKLDTPMFAAKSVKVT
jgi:hypothetical protein